MRYRIIHTTSYTYSEAVPLCQNEVHLKPRGTSRQICLAHRLSVSPVPHQVDQAQDYFGNQIQFFTIQDRHEELTVSAHSEVSLAPPQPSEEQNATWEEVRDRVRREPAGPLVDILQFVFDSPYIAANPEVAEYARPSFPAGRRWLSACAT